MEQEKRKSPERQGDKRPAPSGKRGLLLLAGLALALMLLAALLLVLLFSGLTGREEGQKPSLEDYLAEQWTVFRLRAWDPETGALELDYPLRFSYAQMEKYGAAVEELRELPAGNRETVAALQSAARESTGARIRSVTVYGLTSDGQVAYTLFPDGSVECCWQADKGLIEN
ncbi:MAG: hypothetical protein IKH77_04795 [Clostridia bacterium]|nr:hypothetical protein [Oscillospiraceae bacterium]MBR6954337.1 hypothetical protein [Clostridia bacterium]